MSSIELSYEVNNSDLRDTFFQEILPKCIDDLKENTEPDWGKMSSQHMVEHLILSFKMSTDKLDLECSTSEEKRAKLQAFLNMNRPMPKGFINPVAGTELLDLQYQNLKQAKEKLKEEVQYYLAYYRENSEIIQINPTFGELDSEQWEKFHFKHCFHHLSQFNLITSNQNEGN